MEGNARTWFTSKQKAELWERWRSGQCVADIADLAAVAHLVPINIIIGTIFRRPERT